MSETEKLIDLVRDRTFLYDMNDPEYKNRAKRLITWTQIAEEMGSGNADTWIGKWKGLRDNYVKFKKSSEPEHAEFYKPYKNWPWAEYLKFLDNYYSSRRMPKPKPKRREETPSHVDLNDENTANSDSSTDHTDQERQELTDEEDNDNLDGVDYFFLSYAQSFKKLPVRMQIMLKLEIATLFSRYELQADGVSPDSIDNIPRVVLPVKLESDCTFDFDG